MHLRDSKISIRKINECKTKHKEILYFQSVAVFYLGLFEKKFIQLINISEVSRIKKYNSADIGKITS